MTAAFLFDLDGTLLDSKGDLADAANAARRDLGFPPLSDAQVERHTGWGMAALLRGVLPEADAAGLERARVVFIDYYRAHLAVRSRPYPTVEAMFDALRGYRLGLVTNKPSMFTVPLLESLGWTRRFDTIVCGDTLPQRKPAPEPLLHGIAALGLTPEACVFVGDTPIDRDTAAHAGVRFVGVSWGRAAVEAEAAHPSVATITDLTTLATRFP